MNKPGDARVVTDINCCIDAGDIPSRERCCAPVLLHLKSDGDGGPHYRTWRSVTGGRRLVIQHRDVGNCNGGIDRVIRTTGAAECDRCEGGQRSENSARVCRAIRVKQPWLELVRPHCKSVLPYVNMIVAQGVDYAPRFHPRANGTCFSTKDGVAGGYADRYGGGPAISVLKVGRDERQSAWSATPCYAPCKELTGHLHLDRNPFQFVRQPANPGILGEDLDGWSTIRSEAYSGPDHAWDG